MKKSSPAFLTRTEIDWLLGKKQVSKAYEYRIKSDIKKKLQTFQNLELPLLAKLGYDCSTFGLSANPQNLRTNPQPQPTLVAKLAEGRLSKPLHETVENTEALDGIRTHDLRFTKPSLCQAELLGQNIRNFWRSLFNA